MEFIRKGIEGIFGGEDEKHSHTHQGEVCHDLHVEHRENRFQSFAPQTSGHVKWHIDGCSYFWALSEALEGGIMSSFFSFQNVAENLSCGLYPLFLKIATNANENFTAG